MAKLNGGVNESNAAEDPLDSYSATVIRVAETVTPHVAAIEMTGNGRNGRFRVGAGSAVLFTSDGYLVTNAHVVGAAGRATQSSPTGPRTAVEVVGPTRCPILPSSMARPPRRHRRNSATPNPSRSASSLSPSAIRWGSPAP